MNTPPEALGGGGAERALGGSRVNAKPPRRHSERAAGPRRQRDARKQPSSVHRSLLARRTAKVDVRRARRGGSARGEQTRAAERHENRRPRLAHARITAARLANCNHGHVYPDRDTAVIAHRCSRREEARGAQRVTPRSLGRAERVRRDEARRAPERTRSSPRNLVTSVLSAQRWSTDASRAERSGAQLRRAGDESTRRFGSALITSISATPLAHCLMMNYARPPLA